MVAAWCSGSRYLAVNYHRGGGFSAWNPFVIGLAWVERLGYCYSDAIVGTMPNLGEHVKNILGYEKPTVCIPMGIDDSMRADVLMCRMITRPSICRRENSSSLMLERSGSPSALDTFFDCAESLVDNASIRF